MPTKLTSLYEGEQLRVVEEALQKVMDLKDGDREKAANLLLSNVSIMVEYSRLLGESEEPIDKSYVVLGALLNSLHHNLLVATSIAAHAIGQLKGDDRDDVFHNTVHNLTEQVIKAAALAEGAMGCRTKVDFLGEEGETPTCH